LGESSKGADPRACAACHDARYIPMVDRWKSQGRELAAEAKRLASEGARAAAGSPKGSDARRIAEDLEFNARFLEEGHPVHNIEYSIKVLQASGRLLKELGEAGGRPAGAASRVPYARDAFSYCIDSCHTFIPREEPYAFQGVDVPHRYHIEEAGLSCDICHEEGRHKSLNFGTPRDCAACHHESSDADCARCHRRQAALYTGDLPADLGVAAAPDVMSEMVACADCHDPTAGEPLAAVAEACDACHEEQGSEFLETWRRKLAGGFSRTSRLEEELTLALRGRERLEEDTADSRRRLRTIRDRLRFLERARGVHNMAAAESILDHAERELKVLIQEAQAK